ncbi:DNA polymerase III subunit beta [bacterium]|nr:DNA polymerase III subunit beta [bacterium]
MKISLSQEKFAKAINVVSRVVGSRTSLPILANILLDAHDGTLTLSATNLEIALTVSIGCKIEQTGSTSVPARLLNEVVQGLQSDKLQLVSNGDTLEISAAHTQASIQGIASEEFPAIPTVDAKQSITLPGQLFKDLLERVSKAASLDESRPVLAGVYIHTDKSTLTLAATDSYRLAEEKVVLKDIPSFQSILPIRTVQEVIRLINPDEQEEVSLIVGENEIKFTSGDITLISRLIEGNFPNYTQIIPTESKTTLTCQRDELMAATRLAGVFARESAHTVRVTAEQGLMKIYAEAAQVGQNTSEVPIELKGDATEISLNARFLLDALGAYSEPQVEIRLNEKLDPCVVVPLQPRDNQQSLHLIMPLRS